MTAAWGTRPGGDDDATDADAFKQAMRRVAHSITIVTTTFEGRPYGLIATSVASVSAEPPTLLVCVDRASATHDPIRDAGTFCLNVLGPDDQAIADQFARPDRRNERFGTGTWTAMATGAPMLASAGAAFDCEVAEAIPYHTHTIFLGVVKGVVVAADAADPLVYLDRSYRRLAPR